VKAQVPLNEPFFILREMGEAKDEWLTAGVEVTGNNKGNRQYGRG
jgi:hypothetical protein